jgi:hypothetical protein
LVQSIRPQSVASYRPFHLIEIIMKSLAPSVAILALSFAATSQAYYYISPPGTETIQGNSGSSISLSYAASQVQQIDNTLTSITSPLITGIAFRRSSGPLPKSTTTHTAEIEMKVGHGVFSAVTSTYASNYSGPPTVAFAKQKLLMDWTKTSPTTPPEFDVVLPFTAPFLYNKTDALVWETNTTTGVKASPNYTQDWFSGNSPATIYGPIPASLGGGCTTSNGPMELRSRFQSSGPTNFDYGFGITGGPSNQSTLMFIGVRDPDFPLFCGRLHVDPLVDISLGSTSASGAIGITNSSTTWNSSLADQQIITQAYALDPSQASGIAMSNGLRSRTFRSPGGSHPYNIKRLYNTSSANNVTGSNPSRSTVATKYIQ